MEIYQDQLSGFFRDTLIAIVGAIMFMASFFSLGSTAHAATPEKVEIIYFYGAECSHCIELKPWLTQFEKEHADTVSIKRYEVWHNQTNAQFFTSTMKMYHVPENMQGTPAMVVNNRVLIGTKEIEQNLEVEVNNAQESALQSKNGNGEAGLLSDGNLGEKVANGEVKDLKAITLTALADSINPCAMAVLVILLSSLIVMQKDKKNVALTAVAFVVASYIMYFLVGLGITQVIAIAGASEKLIIAVGAIALLVGLAELKDALFYKKGGWTTEIPHRWRDKLSKLILSVTSPAGAFLVGLAVTLFELPCTGGPYLFGLSLISQHSQAVAFALLAYYNVIFVLPLIIIAVVVIASSKSIEKVEAIEQFRNNHVKAMHGIVGIIMVFMGCWALFIR